jgi:NADPH:quinone reductase-like Zn-dependent oxidoreductase
MQMPAEMDALVVEGHGKDAMDALAKLHLARLPIPRPGPGQVLVRMFAAPCNPADLLYLEGRYGIDRPLPATPGFEGARWGCLNGQSFAICILASAAT